MDFRDLLVEHYIHFKEWQLEAPSADDIERFELETKGYLPLTSAKIFEVGFGQGHFLNWAQDKGHQVAGTEIIPSLVTSAQTRGIRAYNVRIQNLTPEIFGHDLDLVVAFDVMEHLYPDEIIQFLHLSYNCLKPGGYLLARFPNGQSPFSAYYQNGDVTHVTSLSGAKLKQLGALEGYRFIAVRNAARPLGRGFARRCLRRIVYALRDGVSFFLARIFWGDIEPMDPNVTVGLQKPILMQNEKQLDA